MLNLDKILTEHTAWLRGEPGGRRADLRGADLSGTYLRGVELDEADLRGANLREAILCWAYLRGACLCGADLGGADLSKARLRDADLREANLRGANLRWADLSKASLCGADLSKADLYGADLRGAGLTRANLSGRIPLHADTARCYVLYVFPEVRGGPRFVAGCRNFTADEALSHWGPESRHSQPEYVAAIQQWLADNAENAGKV